MVEGTGYDDGTEVDDGTDPGDPVLEVRDVPVTRVDGPALILEDELEEESADTALSLEIDFGNVSNHPDPENSPHPAKL